MTSGIRFGISPFRELPPGTRTLAILFFAGWLAEMLFSARLNVSMGLVPFIFLKELWLWQCVTYIFIHAGFWHFLFNVLMLWMLGRMLEPLMGTRKFLTYFIGCGVAAAVVTAAWTPDSLRPVIGASGAVFGLLGAFAFLYPESTVYLYFLFPVSARTMAVLLGIVELVMTFSSPGSGISNITHLAGLAAGLAWLWGERRLNERMTFSREPVYSPVELERAEIDRILEKISVKGRSSLSSSEISRLDEYARRKGGKA